MIPATHMLTVSDYVYRLKTAKADAVICTPQNEVPEKIRAALAAAGMSCPLWCVQQDVEGFRNLTTEMRSAPTDMPRQETSVDDAMLLYFTSGTTLLMGNFKGYEQVEGSMGTISPLPHRAAGQKRRADPRGRDR